VVRAHRRAGLPTGSFTVADTTLVADVQALLALQTPFYVAGIILVRLVTALGSTRDLTWISLVNTLLNVVLNLVLIRYMGLPGIALATSLMVPGLVQDAALSTCDGGTPSGSYDEPANLGPLSERQSAPVRFGRTTAVVPVAPRGPR
jgi:hypothetical protein